MTSLLTFVTIKYNCNIINQIPFAVQYILMTYLFCNWRFVPFIPPSPICPLPHPSLLGATHLFFVPVSLFLFCYVCWFVLKILHISEIIQYLPFSVSLQHNILQVHSCCQNWQNLILFYGRLIFHCGASLVAQCKEPSCQTETQVQSLGQEDPLEKEMATHSSILVWEIPLTEDLWATVHGVVKESDVTQGLNNNNIPLYIYHISFIHDYLGYFHILALIFT